MLDDLRYEAARLLFAEDFDAAEAAISRSPLDGDMKAAAWLYVWSLQERGDQLRFVETLIRELGVLHG